MPFGGFHPLELGAILAIALLIFGPKKLPQMGASVGKTIQEFKKSMKEMREPAHTDADTSATKLAAIESEIAARREGTFTATTQRPIVETNVD